MTEQKIKDLFISANPEVSEHYKLLIRNTMEHLMEQEEQMKGSTKQAVKTVGRFSLKTIAIALLIAVLVSAVALAAIQWHIFDNLSLSFLFRANVSPTADSLIQGNLYKKTVNNVEITVKEAGYDGRTLLLEYAYRILDSDESYGITAEEMFGNPLPAGMTAGTFVSYREEEAEKALRDHNVGWWIDSLWINGEEIDMAGGSGDVIIGSDIPGEIIHTEYWRLDNIGVTLNGSVQISLPIGESQNLSDYSAFDHPEKYSEDGKLKMPEKGLVTFFYDTGDIQARIKVCHPEKKTVLREGTITVKEAAFTPLMTYITLGLESNPDARAVFLAENGKTTPDEDGNPDLGSYIMSLELVDGNGTVLFPAYPGMDSLGNGEVKFLYPALESLPDELWLAPVEYDGTADFNRAIPVITAE